MAREQRRLAAILAADVVGYSRLMGRDESGTLARLKEHRRERLEPALARNNGRLVKLTGDGALVEFGSAVDALRAAIEFQQAVEQAGAALPEEQRVVFRVGLHVGDLIVEDDDLYGDGVNVAARLEAEAAPGGIVISGALHEAAAGKVQAEFVDLGRLSLKNIDRAVQAYHVEWGQDGGRPTVTRGAARPPLPDKPSVAVLPFDNMSGDPEQVYFADELAEDLITGLSRISWLFVIARNSSFAFRGEKLDARTIGERLGVRYLVEGSVRRSGPRLRLTVQLIEAATGNHLWADKYDGALEDVFDFQDQVVASLIGAIEPKLWSTEIARARRKRPDSLDAFDLYLQALPKVATMSEQGILEATELLDRAIHLSPNYAQALAYAALCRTLRPLLAYSTDEAGDFRAASELSRRALDSDPTDPVALRLAAFIDVFLKHDYQTGCELVDRSLAINPNDALTWSTRGWISTWAGETDTAMREFEHAMRLSPLDAHWSSTVAHGMAMALCFGGRADEALPWARRVLQERPDWSVAHRSLIGTLWLSGRHGEASDAVRRHMELFPSFSIAHDRKISPVRGTAGQDRYFEALREAGLPE